MGSVQPTLDVGIPSVPSHTMNQSSQITNLAEHDPSPAGFDFSFDQYGDETQDTFEERDEAKRRRIARACDMCRKKKIKCDGKMPACSHCINYKTECIFTHVEKKRAPPKGAKYIEGLENRLGRMEALLKLSGLLSDEDVDRTDLGTLEKKLADKTSSKSNEVSPANSPPSLTVSQPPPIPSPHTPAPQVNRMPSPQSSAASPKQTEAKKPEEEVEALSDMMCSLVTNNLGETRYIGSSSGFSIFSPKGISWISEKTGDNSFHDMISKAAADDTKWVYWRPEIFSDMFARRTFMSLPPKHEALSLCKDFFDNFNLMFPLFHEPTFMHLVEKQYSRQPYEGSGWWASFNIALAIAHRIRVMSNLVPQEEDNKAWMYLKNAMGVLTELTMRNSDLLSVQALLGMVHSPLPHAMFLLGTPNPQPSFFLVAAAIRLASSIGLHKRGSGFNLNPVEVEQRKRVFWISYILDKDICLRSGRPPAQDDDDMNVDLPSDHPMDNIGNIPLVDGKGKINLFRLMCTFAVIESKVYRQLYSTKASKQSDGALLNTIGELDKELEEWKDAIPIDIRPEHEIKAAHPPLVLHIDPRARSDVRLMNQVVNFLSLLAVTEEQGGIKRMLGLCVEFERIAKLVLDKAEKETHSKRKRKSNVGLEDNGRNRKEGTLRLSAPMTPTSQNQQHSPKVFTPTFAGDLNQQKAFDPNLNGFSPIANNNSSMPLDFAGMLNQPAVMQPSASDHDFPQFTGDNDSPLNMGSFQQPFVPQDFWQMPQTLEWDWADMNYMGMAAFNGDAGQYQPPSDVYSGTELNSPP
ncbi:MAG: hypothetical protein Q9210_004053 [Variospora velana]